MRICIFTESFFPKLGGQETVVDHLARHYQAAGHEVVVLTQLARGVVPDDAKFPYPVRRYRKPLSQVWGIPTLRRALRQLHREWPYDVIHAQSAYPTGYASLLVARALNVPLVVTSHGTDISHDSRFRGRRIIVNRIRQTLRQVDAATAMSIYMTERMLAIEPNCQKNIRDIPNGVDCRAYTAPATRSPQLPELRSPYVLFLGRLHRRKGVDTLIEAFPANAGVDLVIVGDGNERDALVRQAHGKPIRFLGAIVGSDKYWLLQNALFVVTPTRTWESFCLVVVEAMCCAKPVIGTEVGGISDLIQPGQNGLLVPPEDPKALAAALQQLLTDKPLRRRLGEMAFKTSRRFDWPVVAAQFTSLFEGLMRGHHPR